MVPLLVDQPDRVEHLHRMVRVEARKDLRDISEISVDELTQTTVVVNRAGAGAPRDEELEVRDAERVLDIDGEEAEAKRVLGGGPEAVLVRPRGRFAGAVLVRDPPDLTNTARVEMRRERKLRHVRSGVAPSWHSSRPRRTLLRSTPKGGCEGPLPKRYAQNPHG